VEAVLGRPVEAPLLEVHCQVLLQYSNTASQLVRRIRHRLAKAPNSWRALAMAAYSNWLTHPEEGRELVDELLRHALALPAHHQLGALLATDPIDKNRQTRTRRGSSALLIRDAKSSRRGNRAKGLVWVGWACTNRWSPPSESQRATVPAAAAAARKERTEGRPRLGLEEEDDSWGCGRRGWVESGRRRAESGRRARRCRERRRREAAMDGSLSEWIKCRLDEPFVICTLVVN
jgi:hypothetical protein